MRILVERTGGFAGIKKKAAVDSEALPAEESTELKRLVDAAGILNPAAATAAQQAAAQHYADHFQYTVTVESSDGQRTKQLQEPVNPDVKRLLDWVWAHKK
jgi:hypothetical protein